MRKKVSISVHLFCPCRKWFFWSSDASQRLFGTSGGNRVMNLSVDKRCRPIYNFNSCSQRLKDWILGTTGARNEIVNSKIAQGQRSSKQNCGRNAIINNIYRIVSVFAKTTLLYAVTFTKPAFPRVSFVIQITTKPHWEHFHCSITSDVRWINTIFYPNLRIPH